MKQLFKGDSEERARKRNLCISIVKRMTENPKMLDGTYGLQEITEEFCFRQRDIKYYLPDFFRLASHDQYRIQSGMREMIEKFLLAHEKAVPSLDEAKVMFLKTFGRFYNNTEKGHYSFDVKRLNRIYADLHDAIIILHWG